MKKIALYILIFSMSLTSVSAKSRTGLTSSLIKEWQSEVDRSICPDFRYPSYEPSIVKGEAVYQSNCASCHGVTPTGNKAKLRSQSVEKHFEFVCGGDGTPATANHKFSTKLDQAQRWDALMFYRANILGYFKEGSQELADMDALFGGNCAVCHGTRGQGDGNLHKSLYPVPANFTMFKRLYTRSDEKLFNEITYGIPWTAMPAWKNRYDFDKQTNFDEELIWKLVRYVRQFGFSQELDRLQVGRERLEEYKRSIGEIK
jgi:mono/diheme cytochrome c family protein